MWFMVTYTSASSNLLLINDFISQDLVPRSFYIR